MENPRWNQEAEDDYITSASGRGLFCDVCGYEDFTGGDDGFFYCSQCGSQSQDVIATEADADDVYGTEGGVGALYSIFHHRAKSHSSPSSSKTDFKLPSKQEILRSLTQSAADPSKKDSEESLNGFEDESSSMHDFGYQGCKDTDKAVCAVRLRYVQGLQVMLQLQCEALVEKFGVSPLICGMAMTIWLRYVAVSRVFDDGWVERTVSKAKVAADARFIEKFKLVEPEVIIGGKEKQGTQEKIRSKSRMKFSKTNAQKSIYISFRSLRNKIPVYSTLAISFLSCHLGRVAVLPTDIYKWVSEAKLPYLSAFADLEKFLGAPKFCPLSSRFMFRPIRVISASLLEVTAASIAQSIGLRTPSVNFYAIALRYLKAIPLPVAKILPQACHLYEWSLPSELWLSSCTCALPTRVYVMSMLIVAIRVLYNIHGQGVWEKNLLEMSNSSSFDHKHQDAAQEHDARESSAPNDSPCNQTSKFCTKELLQVLDTAYNRMSTIHEYSKDLRTYLKYCGDVIFYGLTPSHEEGKLIERLWDLYDKKEDDDQRVDAETNFFELKVKRPRDSESINRSIDSKKVKEEKQDITRTQVCTLSSSTPVRNAAIEHMKFDMEDNGFQYLPPRGVKKADGYLQYKRQKADGKFIYVAHADYYILLRACAKLAEVDPRILHLGVLKFEKRLDWIEQRIDQSLNLLQKCSFQGGD